MEGSPWWNNVINQTTVISTVSECRDVIDGIMRRAPSYHQNPNWPFTDEKVVVAIDCEGVHLGPEGQVMLIQLATMSGSVYIFDVYKCPGMIDAGLERILESDKVVKIIHDHRNDAVNLYNQYGIILDCFFDTQIAHMVLCHQKGDLPNRISLNSLCQTYGGTGNPLKDDMKDVYRSNPRYWETRPLTEKMIVYAASDVLSLVSGNMYKTIVKAIRPLSYETMKKLSKLSFLRNEVVRSRMPESTSYVSQPVATEVANESGGGWFTFAAIATAVGAVGVGVLLATEAARSRRNNN